MLNALTGFVVVGVAIAVGYVLGRIDLLGPHAKPVLSTLIYFVLSPTLLFVVLAQSDVRMLFSGLLPVSAIAAVVVFVIYAGFARFAWRRPLGESLVGTLAAGQVNSNNIGIPLALYILGNAAYPAPVILMQLLVFTPVSMALFESLGSEKRKVGVIVRRTLTNPVVVGSVLGVIVALTGLPLPPLVLDPITLIANACVPILLISYGISLAGTRVLGTSAYRKDIILASGLKLVIMPLVAWATAQFVFGLDAHTVLVVTVLAALPTAQNVFNYAQRFEVGETIARDTVFITTLGCVPVLFLVTVLLGPS